MKPSRATCQWKAATVELAQGRLPGGVDGAIGVWRHLPNCPTCVGEYRDLVVHHAQVQWTGSGCMGPVEDLDGVAGAAAHLVLALVLLAAVLWMSCGAR